MNNYEPSRKIGDLPRDSAALSEFGPAAGNFPGVGFDHTVREAEDALARVADEFARGEAPPDVIARLTGAVAAFEQVARSGGVPDEVVRAGATRLLERLSDVTAVGSAWLDTAAPAAAALRQRELVRRAYLPRG